MMSWKKGRGKLGVFDPLLGVWKAEADSPQGVVRVRRSFGRVLGGSYLQIAVHWDIATKRYEEITLVGIGDDGRLAFWSFTSDGKRAQGVWADVGDLHPQAIGFEAEMPAGLARQAYWPDPDDGFRWVVEARTKQGWRRMVEHHYRQVAGA